MKKFLCYDTNDAASGKINVDSRGMLKPNSTVPSTNSTPYQQLVTDGDGNTKWEDRLAYDDSKLVVDAGEDGQMVKVADEVPSWASVDSPIKYWTSNGYNNTVTPIDLGNGSFIAQVAVFITTDNFEVSGSGGSVRFPEKGVYFLVSSEGLYVTGISSADSDTPEITWDGNLSEIKKIDEKFLPDDRFVVTFTVSKDGNIASDKTFAEISTAIESGLYVYGLAIAGATTFDATPVTQVYVLQMNQYALGQGVVFIGLSTSPSALAVLSFYMDADNNISKDELRLVSGK